MLLQEHAVVIAHRGASGSAPENTLASFRLALDQGAPALELDVHRTADGEIVVCHDKTVDRTTDGTGAIAALTLAQIREFDAGIRRGPEFAGERIPTLAEVCRLVRGRAILFVEIKAEGIAEQVISILEAEEMGDQGIPISFSRDAIAAVKAARPELPVGFLTTRAVDLETAVALGADALCLHHAAATQEVADALHARGMALSVWTVNDRAGFERMLAIGADYIATDHPAAALGEWRR